MTEMTRYIVVNVDEKETARHARMELLRDAGYRVHRRDRWGSLARCCSARDFLGPSRPLGLYIRHSLPKTGSHSWAEIHVGSDG